MRDRRSEFYVDPLKGGVVVPSNQSNRIPLFDIYDLAIPPGFTAHLDGPQGQRVVFLFDKEERIVISFEEGMKLMDMLPVGTMSDLSVHTAEFCRNGKYIHLCRYINKKGGFAFFHIELDNGKGKPLCIPGQMLADVGYQWSEEIEPVLLEIMDGLRIPTAEISRKKEMECDT